MLKKLLVKTNTAAGRKSLVNGKNLMLSAIGGHVTERVPVTPHWWGVYKFQLAGICKGHEDEHKGWGLSGQALADVDSFFYETFKPDMLHLSTGASKSQPSDETHALARRELGPAVKELSSKRAIDEYVDAVYQDDSEIEASGIYDHVPILVQRHGKEAMILLNEGNPVCAVFENGGPAGNFQEALIATVEHSENLAYLIFRLHDPALARMRILAKMGAHGYIGSETCVSCDILSPAALRELVFPAQRRFYSEVERLGLIPVVYYLGEIMPIIDDIATLGARALMIEEQKKQYRLDAVEVHRKLNGRMALFGNLDSVYSLLYGKPDGITMETRRQCACAKQGGFIMACGSPLCFDTPAENIIAMLDAARQYPL